MGELIARSVHQAVMEAVAKQNGLTSHRSIFKRLAERGITLDAVTMLGECPCLEKDDSQMGQALEYLLLKPRYAGFIQSALALSDAYEKDLIKDLTGFDQYCQMIAEEIAGRKIPEWRTCLNKDQQLPVPLSKALEALLNGSIGQSAALSMPTGRTELDNRD